MILGTAGNTTFIVNGPYELLPAVLVAVTVYVPDDVAVGVPLITPVFVLNVKPAGNAGLMEYPPAGIAPPVFVGVGIWAAVIVIPW